MLTPDFHPFPDLATARLLLRRILREDAHELFILRSDPRVMRFIAREPAQTAQEAEEFIDRINASIDANEVIMWGIADPEKPAQLIGTITLWQIQREHYRAELGYMLHPEYWGRGLMNEAILKVVAYGFGRLGLHSIEARVDPDNQPSIRVLERTGFVKEGYFREDYFFRGRFLDTVVYSLLAPAG